jgi:hypothetical protein
MEKHHVSLQEKAIATYEASQLKKADVEKNKKAVNLIRQFLLIFGAAVEVDANPFEVDGIRFYVDPLAFSDGEIYGYSIMASRGCPRCGERIVTSVKDYELDQYDPARFGQWLSEPHLCEFRDGKGEAKEAGFIPSKRG